jgi:hypothetical protein
MDHGLELLDEQDCRRLLASENLGRVGISIQALPAILPVHYTMLDGDILFRAGEGLKYRAALDGTVVAFEVDCASTVRQRGWSVLVVGVATRRPDTPPGDWERNLPPSRVPGHEDHLIGIHAELITGRRIALVPLSQSAPPQRNPRR